MIPLMLTVPFILGVGELNMKTVAGLSMLQVFFSSISGVIIHRRNGFVHLKTLLTIGIPLGIFSLAGSFFSAYMKDNLITLIFGTLLIIALVLMLLKKNHQEEDISLKNNSYLSFLIGAGVGTLSGIVGAGGGFILIPLMTVILKIPLKITVGTSLGIVLIGAVFGSLGKIITLQVDYLLVLPVVAGSLISARLGARISKIASPNTIKIVLLIVILLSLIQVVFRLANLTSSEI